ncbi:MAG: nucleotidyl transferase AbiEii/AbiGii toxin family protein [Pseudomonadota bacterium]
MNEAIEKLLQRYAPSSKDDYEHALKEILQEIMLLGLDRAGFFEHAAFYGGTALRIFHGLDRFSEDLDFTLLQSDKHFNLQKYFSSLKKELAAFNFEVHLDRINKNDDRHTEAAFLKTSTHLIFMQITSARTFAKNIPGNQKIKIKFDVDILPATSFESEIKTILLPSPFTVRVLTAPGLFAGKMHAALMRKWKERIKGRDFYDIQWYISRKIPLQQKYLEEKLQQSKAITGPLSKKLLIELFHKRVESIDWKMAKKDILPFLKDKNQLNLWSSDFFKEMITQLELR